MLQHQQGAAQTSEPANETGSAHNASDLSAGQPAHQMRVTAEELALAAASLEGRRDAEHQWRETTLPLDEAIRQLGLNATPQELHSEVEALRMERAARAEKELKQRRSHQERRLSWLGLCICIASLALGVALPSWLGHHRAATHPKMNSPLVPLTIRSLAGVPDNVPVHIDSATLGALAEAPTTPNGVKVDARIDTAEGTQHSEMFRNEWTLVKSGGALFVRAWTTADQALQINNDQEAWVFSEPAPWLPAANTVAVQVPVYRFKSISSTWFKSNSSDAFQGYDAKGDKAGVGTSVVQAHTIEDTASAVDQIMVDYITSSDSDILSYESEGRSNVSAELKGSVVHLTGTATNADKKRHATELANRILKRLHLPYTVSNEMDL